MDINQLRAFIAVAHSQNLTRAAEKLFLSQPAVSAHIKALEADVGTALFTRTNSGMSLTRAGEVLLPEAEALMQHKHRLEAFAQTLREDYVRHALLGLIHPIASGKVSRLTRSIIRREPAAQLHIQYGMSGEILSRLLAKRLHGGFFLGKIEQRTLQSIPLQNIAYSLVCHTDDEKNCAPACRAASTATPGSKCPAFPAATKTCNSSGTATSSPRKNRLSATTRRPSSAWPPTASGWRWCPSTARRPRSGRAAPSP